MGNNTIPIAAIHTKTSILTLTLSVILKLFCCTIILTVAIVGLSVGDIVISVG